MQFIERDIPARHRKAVDAFKRAVEEACEKVALIRTTVEVKSDGERDRVVFTLHDALGGTTAVECALRSRRSRWHCVPARRRAGWCTERRKGKWAPGGPAAARREYFPARS